MIRSYFPAESHLIHLPSMPKTNNMRSKPFWTIAKWEDHVSSWCTGKVTQIRRILGLRKEILMRKWCEFILRDWRRKRVKIRRIMWVLKPLRHHQKVWEGGVQGRGSNSRSGDQSNLIQRSRILYVAI